MCKMGCIRRLSAFNTDAMNDKELSVVVNGFNESEIADILSFISTM